MVDAGIQAHLAHEHELAVAGLVAQPVQLLAHIAGRDEVFFEADTVLRYLDVQVGEAAGRRRYRSGPMSSRRSLVLVTSSQAVVPRGWPLTLAAAAAGVSIGYGDVPTQALTIIQAVVDEGGGGATRHR